MSDERPDGYGTHGTDRSANGLLVVVLITTAFMCVGSIGGAGWFAWRATQNVIDREREARENSDLASQEAERALTRAHFEKLAKVIAASARAGRLPQDIYDPQGKPLLSWRVMLLREAEGDPQLFARFKLDEPWDGPTNRPLLQQMPRMYTPPEPPSATGPNRTFSRGFSHEGAAFGPPNRPTAFRQTSTITAPISDVLIVVDSASSIEWTRPDQLLWNPGDKRPVFREYVLRNDAFLAISADGQVHEVKRTLPDETLRALFETREEKRPGLRITGEMRR